MNFKKMSKDELKMVIEKAKREYDSRIPYNLYKIRADLGSSWRNHYYEETTLLVTANSEDEAEKKANEYINENFSDEEVSDITIQKVSPSDTEYDYEFDDNKIIELERRYSG